MAQGLRIDPQLVLGPAFRPAIVTWNRLEGRPRREDFDRSLKAEVRDALWLLSRQWQFGEFLGEDGGSAVKARVQVETARVGQYSALQGPATGYEDTIPLETMVEREPMPMDLTMRARAGAHWLRLLDEHTTGEHRAAYVTEFAFAEPAGGEELAQLRSDQRAAQTHAALSRRMVDGGRLLAAIRDGRHEAFVTASIPSGDRSGAITAAGLLQEWFGRVYSQPQADDEDAWAPSYLEYQFACAAPSESATGRTVLTAEQYHHGHLDWYSFDVDRDANGRFDDGGDEGGGRFERAAPIEFSPSPVEFGGMPNVRWWELEDRQTEFGDLRASTTDLALLMLAEFGLTYANDWSVVPYDLEVGSLAEMKGIVVTDVFGVRTFIRAAGRGPDEDWQRWGMYNLSRTGAGSPADTLLFVPPVLGKIDESAPIERVVLARDEMANMVWGIEDVIPGAGGRGINGYEAATDLIRHLTPALGGAEPPASGAEIAYRLRTSVAENWIPFIAVHRPDSRRRIRLQRAAMPRLADASNLPVRPRGAILGHGLDAEVPEAYFVHNEEVPKAGAVVTRSFQRARWWDGRAYTWLGRRKQTGRGQGSSGLEFDKLVPVAPRADSEDR